MNYKDETIHAILHFLFRFLVLGFAHIWFPIKNQFRKLWWRAWGHNPNEDINFHIDQMSFNADMFNKALLYSAVSDLSLFFFGKSTEYPLNCRALVEFNNWITLKYQKYSVWKSIEPLMESNTPGEDLIAWFCEVEGLSKTRFNQLLLVNKDLSDLTENIKRIKLRRPVTTD